MTAIVGESVSIGIWAGICAVDLYGPQLSLWRPIAAGTGVAVILHHPMEGAMIAAYLEFLWLCFIDVGAYISPDITLATIIATAIGVASHQGAIASVIVVTPVALLMQRFDRTIRNAMGLLVTKADRAATEGKLSTIERLHLLGIPVHFLVRGMPAAILGYLGLKYSPYLFAYVPNIVLSSLQFADKVIPAVGLGMFIATNSNDELWIFLLVGYFFASFLHVPDVGLLLLGLIIAILYDRVNRGLGSPQPEQHNSEELV